MLRSQTMNRIFALLTGVMLLVAALGCKSPEQAQNFSHWESPFEAEIAAVRELTPLKFITAVRGRDGGYSARVGDRSVWVFGDTILDVAADDGSRWRSSTWCWTRDFDARNGIKGFDEPVDAKGAPAEFLPFTKEESAHNRLYDRSDLPDDKRSRWALWPGPLVVGPEAKKAYVFYGKIFVRVGELNFEATGYSIAVWQAPEKPVIRPEVRPDTDDPTILFPKGDVVLGQAAMRVNNWLYVYGCETKGLSWPCIVARVRFADALNRKAWQFFAGNGRWRTDWKDAVSVMDAAPILSVHWNAYLGKYVAAYSTPFDNSVSIRTADRPEGPWSAGQVIFKCNTPTRDDAWNYSGLAHKEFALENGRLEYFTYYRESGFLRGEIRLVEVIFR